MELHAHRLVGIALILAATALTSSAADNPRQTFVTPEEAAADPDFAIQGEYVGENVGVQVVALGKGEFRVVTYRGGLPGAGWNEREKQAAEEDTEGVQDLIEALALKKVARQSPTLGAAPPAGATVLFDGTPEALEQHWAKGARQTDDGLLMQGCATSARFQDFSLHIEFRLPYMPLARGQGRANSGIYAQGRYETQMLDSFGLDGKNNECGGLYGIKNPDLNMCLPPLSWQTYDIDYTAARWENGQLLANARITVRHNGVVVQSDVELPRQGSGPAQGLFVEAGPITLQDHGNPVRYRNIWLVQRDAALEAKRPLVPGFERFFASTGADPVEGGRLLLSELNCTSCHAPAAGQAQSMLSRQAPILDDVGKRIPPEYLLEFLAKPHDVKPGTLMPDLIAALPEGEREAAVLALVNFFASTGQVTAAGTDTQSVQRGQNLFRQIGCVACHAPRDEKQKVSSKTSVPLVALDKKYTIPSLTEFLQNPHKVRPSGRMPGFAIKPEEARDLAAYLIGAISVKPKNPNMKFAAYLGTWDKVPKFEDLKPVLTGESAGLDLNVAGQTNNFGVRFTGYLNIEKAGEYTFHLGSDDGSLLFIDGKKVVDMDGIHPHQVASGKTALTSGRHALQVDYIQGGGEWTLDLEIEGPGVPRQSSTRFIQMTPEGNPPPATTDAADQLTFVFNPQLVDQGRKLFSSLGCASCHQLKLNGQPLKAQQTPKPLAELDPTRGCLAPLASRTPPAGTLIPEYHLVAAQQTALATAIKAGLPAVAATAAQAIHQTMMTFNCYACHARGGVGGPERDRNPLFTTSIPEMGDEGRIPPALDGVGDKLNDDWLKHVMQNGADDRPYMHARMPKFGMQNVGHLVQNFVAIDRQTTPDLPKVAEAEHRAKAVGRHLVGDKALACIKCHTFGQYKASGIQALNLQTMTRRLRDDWFYRYMLDPQAYRPGTRMPTGYPNGQATVRDVYEGQPDQQLAAIWLFLKDNEKANIPEGLLGNVIELKPEQQPIVYRNFIEGMTRGIAIGYPEKAHLAWDANQFCLALIWHGRFMDAGRHWEGRGVGFQGPLGDHIMRLETTAPLAVLASATEAWPTTPPKERGYRFRGYRLDEQFRPHFRYELHSAAIEDFPKPIATKAEPGFERVLTITSAAPLPNLYFRAVVGQTIEPQPDGWYLVDQSIRIRLPSSGDTQPSVRESAGKKELLVPITLSNGTARIVQEIVW